MTAQHDQIPEIALDWHRAGRGAALATVIETWGSAPRPAGSQMVVDAAGRFMGSVSGGCVEGDVVIAAQEALQTGASRLLDYGVADDTAFGLGLACGGRIRVLVEPVGHAWPDLMLADLVAARAARQPRLYAVDLQSLQRRPIPGPQDPLWPLAEARARADRPGIEGDCFIAVHNPGLRLLIVGAVHIAQPLCLMARACGHEVVIIDPRSAFGSAARFPGERIVDDWPDAALAALAPDARTAVVTLTHDPKLDDPAIRAALAAPVFYLACLGSSRTHAQRLQRLAAAGVAPADLARIHAPAGLAIGAKSPAEIALSILAQMTQVLRQGG